MKFLELFRTELDINEQDKFVLDFIYYVLREIELARPNWDLIRGDITELSPEYCIREMQRSDNSRLFLKIVKNVPILILKDHIERSTLKQFLMETWKSVKNVVNSPAVPLYKFYCFPLNTEQQVSPAN